MKEIVELGEILEAVLRQELNDKREFRALLSDVKSGISGLFPVVSEVEPISSFLLNKGQLDTNIVNQIRCFNNTKSLPELMERRQFEMSPKYTSLIVCHAAILHLIKIENKEEDAELLVNSKRILNALQFLGQVDLTFSGKDKSKWRVDTIALSLFSIIYEKMLDIADMNIFDESCDIAGELCQLVVKASDLPGDIYALIIKMAEKVFVAGSVTQFIDFSRIVLSNGNIPGHVWGEVARLMKPRVEALDAQVVEFFIDILGHSGDHELAGITCQWLSLLMEQVERKLTYDKFSEEPGTVLPIIKCSHEEKVVRSLPYYVDFSHICTYPELVPIESCVLPKENFNSVREVIKSAIKKNKSLAKEFSESALKYLEVVENETFLDACACLYPLLAAANTNLISIFTGRLFDESCGLMKARPGYEGIYALRYHFIKLLLEQDISSFECLLREIKLRPGVFIEVILIFSKIISDTDVIIDEDVREKYCSYIEILAKLCREYFDLLCMENEHFKAIARMRLAGAVALNSLLVRDDIDMLMLITSIDFMNDFFVFVYDQSLISWCLGVYDKLLGMLGEFSDDMVTMIEGLYTTLFKTQSESNLMIAYTVTKWINSTSFQVKIGQTDELLMWIAGSPICGISYALLQEGIWLRLKDPSPTPMNEREVRALEIAINKLYENRKPDILLFSCFLSLISGMKVTKFTDMFYVRSPLVLSLLLSVAKRSDYFTQTVLLFDSLCKYSIRNCYLMHDGDVDLVLANYLIDIAPNPAPDRTAIKAILLLLSRISSNCASALTVHKILSLLCKVDSNTMPCYAPELVESLRTMITSSMRHPDAQIPVHTCSVISVKGLTGKIFTESFSVSIWVMVMSPLENRQYPIITIEDSDMARFALHVNSGYLIAYGEYNKEQWNGQVQTQLEPDVWNLITISVLAGDSKGKMTTTYYVNGVEQRKLLFNNLCYNNGSLKIKIGGSLVACEIAPIGVYIGPLGFYPVVGSTEAIRLYELGPRTKSLALEPYVYIKPFYDGDFVNIQVLAKQNITASMGIVRFERKSSFSDRLCSHCKVDSLLPIFELVNLKMPDGTSVPDFASTIVSLFEATLASSNKIQREFVIDSNGFSIISYLMDHMPKEYITYTLFESFLRLLNVLSNETRDYLIDSIILDVSKWVYLEPELHMRYLKDICVKILPSWKNTKGKYKDKTESNQLGSNEWKPMSLFCLMRKYYCENNEHSFNGDVPRGLSMDEVGRECCSILTDVICDRVETIPSDEFIRIIVSSILTSLDSKENIAIIEEQLRLLETLSKIDARRRIGQSIENNLISVINLGSQWYKAPKNVASSILIRVHDMSNRLPISMSDYVALLMCELSMSDAKFEFDYVQFIADLRDEIPELFPLALQMALRSGKESVTEVGIMENICISGVFCIEHWQIWPVVILFQNQERTRVIHPILYQSGCKNWRIIYNTMIIIGKALKQDYDDVIHDFLIFIGSELMNQAESADKSKLQCFFDLALHHMFYSCDPYYTRLDWLEEQAHSIYSGENSDAKVVKSEVPDKIDYLDLVEKVINLDEKSMRFQWRVRMHVDDKSTGVQWDDVDLAVNMLSLMGDERKNMEKMGLIRAFVQRMDRPMASKVNIEHYPEKLYNLNKMLSPTFFSDRNKEDRDLNQNAKIFLSGQSYLESIANSANDDTKLSQTFTKLQKNYMRVVTNIKNYRLDDQQRHTFLAEFTRKMKAFVAADEARRLRTAKQWKCYWRQTSMRQTYWNGAIQQESSGDWKRDSVLCGSGAYPMKMKQCYKISCSEPKKERRTTCDYSGSSTFEVHMHAKAPASSPEIRKPKKSTGSDEYVCNMISPASIEHNTRIAIKMREKGIAVKNGAKILPFVNIKHIFQKMHLHKFSAIEIYDHDGKSYFINFPNAKIARDFVQKVHFDIDRRIIPEIDIIRNDDEILARVHEEARQWCIGEISNFEYLMKLNFYSGRSFKDTTQYPIMPWILKEYKSDKLSLHHSECYRDLKKPMGVQGKDPRTTWMLAQKHVFSYLLRIYPFAKDPQAYQEHNNIILTSIAALYDRLSPESEQPSSEAAELTPEFFTAPDFLVGQNGAAGVELPPWAQNSPMEFIYLNRKALESTYVSQNLHHWIDMVWGVDQKNQEIGCNFDPHIYPDVWSTLKHDEKLATQELLRENGQAPRPLFTSHHKPRYLVDRADGEHKTVRPNEKGDVPPLTVVTATIINDEVHLLYENGTIREFNAVKGSFKNSRVSKYFMEPKVFESAFANWKSKLDPSQQTTSGALLRQHVKSNRIFFYSLPAICREFISTSAISSVGCDKRFIAIADVDGFLDIHDLKDEKGLVRIPTFCKPITCISVSNSFRTVACGSRDSKIILYSTNMKSITKVIDLGNSRATHIEITPSWGFIVACLEEIENNKTNYYISVFTINGEILRAKMPIEKRVTHMTTWSSRCGFDYVAICDDSNRLWSFEAYYCDLTKVTKLTGTPIAVFYVRGINSFLVVYDTWFEYTGNIQHDYYGNVF